MAKPPILQIPERGHGRLLRVLGVSFGLAVTVGNTIGAGILRTPGEVASHLPHPLLFHSVWILGGFFALLCSLSIAEIATLLPRSGGHYVFAHYTFGAYAGFIVGWSDWLSTCCTMAVVSIIIGEYAGLLVAPLAGQGRWTAMAVVLGFALLQWRGVRWGSGAQEITSLLKAIGFLGLVIACFLSSGPATSASAVSLPRGFSMAASIVLSLQAIIYTYDGWAGVIYFSEEVHNPARDIPRVMFGGILAVIAIYLLLNLAVLHILPLTRIAGDPLPLGTAARLIWGAHADSVLQAVVIVSMLSAINAYQLMACRILFAMSQDGLFPRVVARVNPGGTPYAALWLSTVAAIVFIASGSFEKVMAVAAFFFVFNYIMGLSAVLMLRHRETQRIRPYRTLGYPWTTLLSLGGYIAFLAGAIVSDTRNSLYAGLVLAASYPVFRLVARVSSLQSES